MIRTGAIGTGVIRTGDGDGWDDGPGRGCASSAAPWCSPSSSGGSVPDRCLLNRRPVAPAQRVTEHVPGTEDQSALAIRGLADAPEQGEERVRLTLHIGSAAGRAGDRRIYPRIVGAVEVPDGGDDAAEVVRRVLWARPGVVAGGKAERCGVHPNHVLDRAAEHLGPNPLHLLRVPPGYDICHRLTGVATKGDGATGKLAGCCIGVYRSLETGGDEIKYLLNR